MTGTANELQHQLEHQGKQFFLFWPRPYQQEQKQQQQGRWWHDSQQRHLEHYLQIKITLITS